MWSDIWNISYIEVRIWNQLSYDDRYDHSSIDFISAVQYMKDFTYHFTLYTILWGHKCVFVTPKHSAS